MKLLDMNFRDYMSPEAKVVDLVQEGVLCTSTSTSFDQSQLEGFDKENEFTGWGN